MSFGLKIGETFFITLLLMILIENSLQKEECTESNARKIDGIVAKLLTIGNSGRKFPESTGEDLKKYCE